jgi:hypothetical protein
MKLLAVAAGLAIAIGAMAPALAETIEVSEGSSTGTSDTACAIFEADHLVDEGDPADPADDVYEHVSIYVCGDSFDDDGDGVADRATALSARFIDGHEEERYSGAVDVADVSIDASNGIASINATVPAALSGGSSECTIAVSFAGNGEAVGEDGGGATLAPSLGDGTEVRVATASSYTRSSTPADATGSACGWAELANPSSGATISRYSQTDDYTAVTVNP